MTQHLKEVDFTNKSESEVLVYVIEAQQLGKQYEFALKDQLKRQEVYNTVYKK